MKQIVTALLLIFASHLHAQRYNFKNYTVADGLAQSQINDINQDVEGYLWIGTESGLSRFDGLNFKNYSMANGLPDNKIEKIFFDDQNKLWVGTPNGLACLENDHFKPFVFDEPKRVNDIITFRDQIYVATNSGLLRKDRSGFIPIEDGHEEPLYIRALVNINDEHLICGTRTGIYNYHGEWSVFEDSTFLQYNIGDLALVEDELIIGTFRDGLLNYSFSDRALRQYEINISRIRSIYADTSVILCSSIAGLIEINDQVTYFDENNGMINHRLVCTFKDKEGNYWIGTDGNGLLKFLGKSVISFSTNEGLSSSIVMSISQNLDSSYNFGTYLAGITHLDMLGNISYINTKNGLEDNTIWCSEVDQNGFTWVGTSDGVNCILKGQIVQKEITQKIPSKTRSILIDKDKYFFGGADGIYVMSEGHVLYLDHTSEMNVNDLCLINGDIYAGTRTGLYVIEQKSNFSSSYLTDIPENNVHSVIYDRRGYTWIGTDNGLFVRLKEGVIVPFILDKNDFKSLTILGILESKQGDIWVSTMNGVYLIEQSQQSKTAYRIKHYGTSEGIENLETNLNAIYEDYDEKIWVGTSDGLVRIDPALNSELFDFKTPELHLTGIRLFMEEFDYDRFKAEYNNNSRIPSFISLPYDQNHLTFDFIGINLKDPESVQFEYRLNGSNDSWSPLSTATYATYSDVAPGIYDFEVRAVNKGLKWSEIQTVQIEIRPPYWKTWWFILMIAVVSLFIVAIIFQVRIRAIKQKEENEKLGYKNRLLFLEQQSLNASMNRHFIFNSLNSIQYFINSSDKLSANKYLSSFAKLIRKNLDSSTSNNFIVTLQEEIDRIELYLTLEKMRFQEKFEYKLSISSSLDTESIEIPSMILQPFVENSIIHGVLPLNRKGLIEIKIYEEYGDVVFEVIDDGVGIDNTLKNKKDQMVGDHESKGMEITNRRIELLRKLTGDNLLIIGPFQLNDEDGNSLGTKVIIKMGLNHED